jgi:hypothetical protein
MNKAWENYEKYALDFLRHQWGEEIFEYQSNTKLYNPIREGYIEVDGLIINKLTGQKTILQCKHFEQKPAIELIEGFCFQCQTLNAFGIFITTKGYSKNSKNIEKNIKDIQLQVFSKEQFESYQYFDVVALYCMIDKSNYSEQVADALKLLITHENINSAIQVLDAIEYEEWLNFAHFIFKNYTNLATEFFTRIAISHYDSGWRFNALQLLENYNCLNAETITVIKQKEEDYEILEWLQDL